MRVFVGILGWFVYVCVCECVSLWALSVAWGAGCCTYIAEACCRSVKKNLGHERTELFRLLYKCYCHIIFIHFPFGYILVYILTVYILIVYYIVYLVL